MGAPPKQLSPSSRQSRLQKPHIPLLLYPSCRPSPYSSSQPSGEPSKAWADMQPANRTACATPYTFELKHAPEGAESSAKTVFAFTAFVNKQANFKVLIPFLNLFLRRIFDYTAHVPLFSLSIESQLASNAEY